LEVIKESFHRPRRFRRQKKLANKIPQNILEFLRAQCAANTQRQCVLNGQTAVLRFIVVLRDSLLKILRRHGKKLSVCQKCLSHRIVSFNFVSIDKSTIRHESEKRQNRQFCISLSNLHEKPPSIFTKSREINLLEKKTAQNPANLSPKCNFDEFRYFLSFYRRKEGILSLVFLKLSPLWEESDPVTHPFSPFLGEISPIEGHERGERGEKNQKISCFFSFFCLLNRK